MNTVVVSEKPKGRSISFLPGNKLVRVDKKKTKLYAPGLLCNSVLTFKVEEEGWFKSQPFKMVVEGSSSSQVSKLDKGVYRNFKLKPFEFYINPKFAQKVITEPLSFVVKLGNEMVNSTTETSFDSLIFEVEDTRPIQSIISGGGNVESMEYTMQQQSYYEVKIKFKDADIVSVNNLPLGMLLEKGVVKGAPIYSGIVVSEFTLSNGDTASITFKVSQLPRTL